MFDPETVTVARAALGLISVEWLSCQCIHPSQLAIFADEFPGPAELTRANLRRMGAAGFNIDWLVDRILAAPARTAYRESTMSFAHKIGLGRREVTASLARRIGLDPADTPNRRRFNEAKASILADLLGLPEEGRS